MLARQKVAHTLHNYEVSADAPNYGALVSEAIGADPGRVFKTMVTDVDCALTVAIVPVTGDVDLMALASAAGGKRAAMADRELAEKTTGYVRGGIGPLGQRKRLPTVIDKSALDSETIYVSAGKRGLKVQLAPADLVRLTSATVAPIARSA